MNQVRGPSQRSGLEGRGEVGMQDWTHTDKGRDQGAGPAPQQGLQRCLCGATVRSSARVSARARAWDMSGQGSGQRGSPRVRSGKPKARGKRSSWATRCALSAAGGVAEEHRTGRGLACGGRDSAGWAGIGLRGGNAVGWAGIGPQGGSAEKAWRAWDGGSHGAAAGCARAAARLLLPGGP